MTTISPMKAMSLFLAVGLIGGPLTRMAQAVMITNTTTGTVLLSDNFEDGTVGSLPNAAQIGGWAGTDPAVTPIAVQNEANTGIEPYEGNQFLHQKYRENGEFPSPDNSNSNVTLISDTFATGSAGDVLETTFAIYVDSVVGSVRLHADDTLVTSIFFIVDHDTFSAGDITAAGVGLTGVNHIPDAWNKVVVRYAQGSDELEFSVNDSGFATIDVLNSGMVDHIDFDTNGGVTNFYVDAIPEPASVALMGLGGLMLLRRRRKA